MDDSQVIVEPRTLLPGTTRVEIAPVPNCADAAQWSHYDPPIPRWPLWVMPIALALLIVFSTMPPARGAARAVLHVLATANLLWLSWYLAPLGALLWFTSDRLLRHARKCASTLHSAYYIAWASVSSWKPEIQKSGIDELVALGKRRAHVTEALRHLKWGLWAFEAVCLGVVIGTLTGAQFGFITREVAVRAIIVLALALLTAGFTAFRISSHSRALHPTEEQMRRATELYRQCQEERERRWRWS